MSVQDEQVPPIPQLVAPMREGAAGPGVKGYRFETAWMQWFVQLREKVNILNTSIVNLANLTGIGVLAKNGSAWTLRTITGTPGRVTVTNGDGLAGNPTINIENQVGAIGATFDGAGSVLVVGSKCDVYVPFNFQITAVTLLADQSGSVVVDIWSDAYGNYPPLSGDSITAAAKPTISGSDKGQNTTLTGWTTTGTAGTTLRFNIDSVATITRLLIQLTVMKV